MIHHGLPDYQQVKQIITDSRFSVRPHDAFFFAIRGIRHDGHQFLKELFDKGVRNFVIENDSLEVSLKQIDKESCNVYVCQNSIQALQDLAAQKRAHSSAMIVGVAGSNGKTIVKEWLCQLIESDFKTVKSPRSYNSQIGVALSVWQIEPSTEVAVFEAGISQPNEMQKLEKVISPQIGIFTNIGAAHNEGFKSIKQKISEKLRLFVHAKYLIYRQENLDLDSEIQIILKSVNPQIEFIKWAFGRNVIIETKEIGGAILKIEWKGQWLNFSVPFADEASLENATNAILAALLLGKNPSTLDTESLRPVAMRMSLKEGVNQSVLIDDTYNNDPDGLAMAMNFMAQQGKNRQKTLILSDFKQSNKDHKQLYGQVAGLCREKGISEVFAIGEDLASHQELFEGIKVQCFENTETFLLEFSPASIANRMVLIKGSRVFGFERIVERLEQKMHGTIMEINLDALTHNLNFFRNHASGAKIMAMVKAYAYGSGSSEVAELLQYHRVDYLAVAYLDEGIFLRERGIHLPIMVMNPSAHQFDAMKRYHLEPEIYSKKILVEYLSAKSRPSAIHIKLDTGMHRLGFESQDIAYLVEKLQPENIEIKSIFSHLSSADVPKLRDFTLKQIGLFKNMAGQLATELGQKPILHIANSSGVMAFPEAKFDMVRMGIGLYGIDPTGQFQSHLAPVASLKSVISQIKEVPAHEPIGYSQKGLLPYPAKIGTIAIGYADGYDRRFSKGVGQIMVNGSLCPVVGNVCMDMCMVDLTHASAAEGDTVTIFGTEPSILDLAEQIGTIPYEILTNVSERVKRVFYKE